MTSTKASVTIRDVNDSPPAFNAKNYFVSLSENTPSGTPLPLDMSVHDPDVVCFLFVFFTFVQSDSNKIV